MNMPMASSTAGRSWRALGTITTATLTMGPLLSALKPAYAAAEQVSFNDPEITATYETFPSP